MPNLSFDISNLETLSPNRMPRHPMAAWRLAKAQKDRVRIVWAVSGFSRPSRPCAVELTRIAPRRLDDDNNVGALKHVRDALAALIMGVTSESKIGQADAEKNGITFSYFQAKGPAGYYAVRVKVTECSTS